MKIFVILLVVAIVEAISFAISAGLIWVLSLCFGFTFTWKLALGLWIVFLIVQGIFKPHSKN